MAQASSEENLCHSFQSFNTCYRDTGLWGIYFVADHMKAEDFVYHLQHTWMKICNQVSESEVNRAKNLLKTNLMLTLDGTTPICEDIGRQMLTYGRRIPLPEMEARIDAVDVKTVKDVCTKYIYDRCPAVVGVGPTEAFPDYTEIRSRMYWFKM